MKLLEDPSRQPPLWRIAFALRETLAEGYGLARLRADLLAGLVVGTVALPLAMALAIASGVPPQHGLYTAIVAGAVIAVAGGSRVQVSGPTAAFVVVLSPIAARFGVGGLLLATLMAGGILFILGATGLGRLIEFVPQPVTTGFTSGIAVVIALLQVKDLLGLTVAGAHDHFLDRVAAYWTALPTFQAADLAFGLFALGTLLLWPRISDRVPAPLVALVLAGLASFLLHSLFPAVDFATIASRFSYEEGGTTLSGIPRRLPSFGWPWAAPGPGGTPLGLSLGVVRSLLPSAFAIAMLGAIESLLSAVVAEGMSRTRHDPDAELMAQGTGNLIAPFFGGIAATGAIARTATNVRSGATSPFAAFFHALFVLAAVLVLAPALSWLPMASLAALLLVVAWNMSEAKHFVHLLKTAPRSDVAVLLACFGLTVVFDMTVSVTAGIILASLLFMRRMAEVSGVRLVSSDHPALSEPLPRGIVLYEVAGPLFFGAARRAIETLRNVDQCTVKVIVLDLGAVPAVDATGLGALRELIDEMNAAGLKVVLLRIQRQPLRAMARAGWRNRRGRLRIFRSFDQGLDVARRTVAGR